MPPDERAERIRAALSRTFEQFPVAHIIHVHSLCDGPCEPVPW
jgi:hypothetical protein